MTITAQDFAKLDETVSKNGVRAGLAELQAKLRAEKKYHELFESLKMGIRFDIGLPIVYSEQNSEPTDEQQNQLEAGLLVICREVGTLLMKAGKPREGWMYLRPVGNRSLAEQLLREIPVDEDLIDELIQVSIHEGVAPGYGFGIMLKHYGTCNSITTFEAEMGQQPKWAQQQAAEQLVRHLHKDLLKNVLSDIERQEGAILQDPMLLPAIVERDWLFGEFSYHIDATHLASVVRFSKVLDNKEAIALAADLTEYGLRLNKQYQYQGDEPFGENYPSHRLYLRAALGIEVDQAIEYFRKRADELPPQTAGTIPSETLIELLYRTGRYSAAAEEYVRRIPPNTRTVGISPSLYDICLAMSDFGPLLQASKASEDLLGFATGLFASQLTPKG